jgi:hypothetical protein
MEHGLYLISEAAVTDFENEWLDGRTVDLVTTSYTSGEHDPEYITWEPGVYGQAKRDSLRRFFGETDRRIMFSYAFAESRSDYSRAADGSLDGAYREFARQLVSLGLGDAYVCPSPEFNLPWGRYPNDPGNYAAGYARCVREMQSIGGADFTFVYAPGGNRLGVTDDAWPAAASEWPDGEALPVVAPSFYDTSSTYPDVINDLLQSEREAEQRQAWADNHVEKLDMWRAFADSVGADMGLREWGCATDSYRIVSGGDDPYFIRKLFEYMETHDFRFQGYWNAETAGGGVGGHTIYPPEASELIEAGQAWRDAVLADMGGGGGSTGDEPSEPSEPADPPEPDRTYGGYVRPQEGTVDWHVPLNQNFADIEADIEDLAERLDRLESS